MNLYQILPLIIAPLFLFFFLFLLKIKFGIKNYQNIILAFVLGVFSSILLIFSSNFFILSDNKNILQITIFAFIITAFSSELGKFLMLFFGFFKKKNFLGPIESIIYSIFISMGFSLATSILFATEFISPIDNTLFPYIFGIYNLILAIILGFFVGVGKTKKKSFIFLMIGLITATLFHGFLNFCIITKDYRLLSFVAMFSIITCIVFIIKTIDYRPTIKIN